MHYAETPFALTEHAAHGVGHFLFHTKAGLILVNAGVLLGVGILLYKGGQALWNGMFKTRSSVQNLLAR